MLHFKYKSIFSLSTGWLRLELEYSREVVLLSNIPPLDKLLFSKPYHFHDLKTMECESCVCRHQSNSRSCLMDIKSNFDFLLRPRLAQERYLMTGLAPYPVKHRAWQWTCTWCRLQCQPITGCQLQPVAMWPSLYMTHKMTKTSWSTILSFRFSDYFAEALNFVIRDWFMLHCRVWFLRPIQIKCLIHNFAISKKSRPVAFKSSIRFIINIPYIMAHWTFIIHPHFGNTFMHATYL